MPVPNLYTDISCTDLTATQIQKRCEFLFNEYRGGGQTLWEPTKFSSLVIQEHNYKYNLYIAIIKDIIDVENKTFTNSPTLTFQTKSGKKVAASIQAYIQQMFDDMRFNEFMLQFERYAALLGTVFIRPVVTSDGKMTLFSIMPNDPTLKIEPDEEIPGKPKSIEYILGGNTKVIWDAVNVSKSSNSFEAQSTPHNYKGLPFAILNYFPSNSIVLGPPDGTLYSFCRQRNFVLSEVCSRLHLSDHDKLVLYGMTPEEGYSVIQKKLIVLPNDKRDKKTGDHIPQKAEFIHTDSQEASNMFKTYLEFYYHLKDTRGHAPKNFTRGADAQSAEAVRLGGVDLRDKIQSKRAALTRTIKDIFKLVIWANNVSELSTMQLPDNLDVQIDYKPDPYNFTNATDEVTYFTTALKEGIESPVTWFLQRNPEFTREEAIEAIKMRKQDTKEIKEFLTNTTETPTPPEPEGNGAMLVQPEMGSEDPEMME